jgi:hypothetical protein
MGPQFAGLKVQLLFDANIDDWGTKLIQTVAVAGGTLAQPFFLL